MMEFLNFEPFSFGGETSKTRWIKIQFHLECGSIPPEVLVKAPTIKNIELDIVWFKRDLRTIDNKSLEFASNQLTQHYLYTFLNHQS